MHLQTVFCVFYLWALVGKSTSWELIEFQWVKSVDDEFLCATSPANKTLSSVQSRLRCVNSCNHVCPSLCQAVNYRQTSRLCEIFYYEPSFYDAQPDCVNFQVG